MFIATIASHPPLIAAEATSTISLTFGENFVQRGILVSFLSDEIISATFTGSISADDPSSSVIELLRFISKA